VKCFKCTGVSGAVFGYDLATLAIWVVPTLTIMWYQRYSSVMLLVQGPPGLPFSLGFVAQHMMLRVFLASTLKIRLTEDLLAIWTNCLSALVGGFSLKFETKELEDLQPLHRCRCSKKETVVIEENRMKIPMRVGKPSFLVLQLPRVASCVSMIDWNEMSEAKRCFEVE